MLIIGLDVGFSATRRSTGVARLAPDGALRLGHTTSQWERRREIIGLERAAVAAIDAPYTTAAPAETRGCERIFARGAFQRRCKPGLSHVRGTGRDLRAAGWASAQQLKPIAPYAALAAEFPRVDGCNVIEAFPNAYLGVCLPAEAYTSSPGVGRGQKFDWLYDGWLRRNLFRPLLGEIGWRPLAGVERACAINEHHDERAALVCLLTAAGVAAGRYTAVGDAAAGYLFLPPWPRWAAWARAALDRERSRLPGLEVWIDGRRHRHADPLPTPT